MSTSNTAELVAQAAKIVVRKEELTVSNVPARFALHDGDPAKTPLERDLFCIDPSRFFTFRGPP